MWRHRFGARELAILAARRSPGISAGLLLHRLAVGVHPPQPPDLFRANMTARDKLSEFAVLAEIEAPLRPYVRFEHCAVAPAQLVLPGAR